MKLTPNDLFLLCQSAISAAYQAGHLISEYAGKQLNIKNKTDGRSLASQIVTEVDLLSQELILKTLFPTCKIYDIALLTEESTDDKSRFEKDYFWCIDPLDGTLPFTEQKPGYAVSIALVAKDGIPQIGVVYDPVRKNLYHAIKGSGVFKNGNQLKMSEIRDTDQHGLKVFFDRSFFNGKLYEVTKQELNSLISEMGFKDMNISQVGGSVVSAIQIIEQAPACYFKYPRPEDSGGSLWDYAATACIFNELGLIATDIYGQPMELNRAESTFMNHKGFVFASEFEIGEQVKILFEKISKT
jgi:myo-inositol-1(or 4)-monophosphatase